MQQAEWYQIVIVCTLAALGSIVGGIALCLAIVWFADRHL